MTGWVLNCYEQFVVDISGFMSALGRKWWTCWENSVRRPHRDLISVDKNAMVRRLVPNDRFLQTNHKTVEGDLQKITFFCHEEKTMGIYVCWFVIYTYLACIQKKCNFFFFRRAQQVFAFEEEMTGIDQRTKPKYTKCIGDFQKIYRLRFLINIIVVAICGGLLLLDSWNRCPAGRPRYICHAPVTLHRMVNVCRQLRRHTWGIDETRWGESIRERNRPCG